LSDYEYVEKLVKAGFEKIDIEATRIYDIDDAPSCQTGALMWRTWRESWMASLSARLFARPSRLRIVVRQIVVIDG